MSTGMHPSGTSGPSPSSYLDAEHDHIESPAALYRHLYEEHHVEEARDLDPDTAPVQFWLRRHAELERAARQDAARGETGDTLSGHAGDAGHAATRSPGNAPDRPRTAPGTVTRTTEAVGGRPAVSRPAARRGDDRAPAGSRHGQDTGGPSGGDPLLHAIAAALVRRGHDERVVRRYISSCPGAGGVPAGPDAFRYRFVRPLLDEVEGELTAAGAPTAAPPEPLEPLNTAAPAPAEPPSAARRAVTRSHADHRSHAEPRGRAESRDPVDDVMALADAVQRPQIRHARPAHPVIYKLDDDVMALADAVQRPRGG